MRFPKSYLFLYTSMIANQKFTVGAWFKHTNTHWEREIEIERMRERKRLFTLLKRKREEREKDWLLTLHKREREDVVKRVCVELANCTEKCQDTDKIRRVLWKLKQINFVFTPGIEPRTAASISEHGSLRQQHFCVPMIFGWADKSIPAPTLWTDEDFCFNNMTDPVSKYFISFWASTCARKGEKGWERREKGGERRNQKRKLKDFLSGSL